MPTTTILPATLDFMFKYIFGSESNADILADFLSAVLDIPQAEIDGLTILNPFLMQEIQSDKFGVLDVKLRLKSGVVIDVEIQDELVPNFDSRVMFYLSKMVTEQIKSGNKYGVIRPAVCIIVSGFPFPNGNERYHNAFTLNNGAGWQFTDKLSVHTLELPKLPEQFDGSPLHNWLRFIKTDKEDELMELSHKSPTLEKAVETRFKASEDERMRAAAFSREVYEHDQATKLDFARTQGISQVARNLLKLGQSSVFVSQVTGLSLKEIDELD